VVQQRVIGGRHEQQVLMPPDAVRIRHPKRKPELIRYRTGQADGAREAAIARCSPAREQLRGL
jgi:hypothetical protein